MSSSALRGKQQAAPEVVDWDSGTVTLDRSLMDFFCCIFPSSDNGERNEKEEDTRKDVSKGEPLLQYNLFSDEGTSYQHDLWQLVIAEKREAIIAAARRLDRSRRDSTALVDFGTPSGMDGEQPTAESYLQNLTAIYNANGFAQRMPRIREIFASIEPFISCVSTVAHSNTLSALIWGSLTLVFQAVARMASFWEDLRTMFNDLARTLPRFHAYTEVLRTPRLHTCLRDVYSMFIDLCVMASDYMGRNQCYALVRIQWPSFTTDFGAAAMKLAIEVAQFEKELHLANVQEQSKRHKEVLSALQGTSNGNGPQTNVTIPRNERFTGRQSTLAAIHTVLTPSLTGQPGPRTACSCLIHAIGGMGKTETALEYTYQFRKCYSHIFWLRAQTRELLFKSFLKMAEELGVGNEAGLEPSKKVQLGLHWLRSTDKPWLLVYDNAEDVAVIRDFWPASTIGAIIITSQNPALGALTKSSIQLGPMTNEEGSELIRSFLHRGGSENDSAQQLSHLLGGLPLAIVHFAGCVARSQCPIDQITQSLNQRFRSSQIWRLELPINDARKYQSTLDTVWDVAISRLSSDSIRLLEFIAFLDPDQIPVDLFIGPRSGVQVDTTEWQYWDVDRFNDALGILCERNLVERYSSGSLDVLRTHRVLQRSILQRLDEDLTRRNERFDEVVAIVRKAVPTANVEKRADASQFALFAKYLPQVMSVYTNYSQSDPAIRGTLQFASVISDTGFYGMAQENFAVTIPLLEAGAAICTELQEASPEQARKLLADILGVLQVRLQSQGTKGRERCLELTNQVVRLREAELKDIPRDQWTTRQTIDAARAQIDLGCVLNQLDRINDAEGPFQLGIGYYRTINNKVRLNHALSCQLGSLSALQRKEETRQQAARTVEAMESELGADNPLTLQTKFYAACAYFTIGDVDKALELHLESYGGRATRFGNRHDLTLGSQYCLSVCYHRMNELESAESNLREILDVGCLSAEWREEDINRAKFRLSVVLRDQSRPTEASKLRAEMADHIGTLRSTEKGNEYTDADDMALLDAEVSLKHGRTAGIWSNGGLW